MIHPARIPSLFRPENQSRIPARGTSSRSFGPASRLTSRCCHHGFGRRYSIHVLADVQRKRLYGREFPLRSRCNNVPQRSSQWTSIVG